MADSTVAPFLEELSYKRNLITEKRHQECIHLKKNENHIELVCVINGKLNTQVIICSVSIDGVAV